MAGATTEDEPNVLIVANIDEGVVSAPLSKTSALSNPFDLTIAVLLTTIWGLICQSQAYD
jgi:hypothetical protein